MNIAWTANPVLDAERWAWYKDELRREEKRKHVCCCYCGEPIPSDTCYILDKRDKKGSALCKKCKTDLVRPLRILMDIGNEEAKESYRFFSELLDEMEGETPKEEE